MVQTVVYLDVDGVINALSDNPPRNNTGWRGGWDKTIVSVPGEGLSFNILHSQELLAALEELALRPAVQIRWLTTWQKHAPGALSTQLGWDLGAQLPVVKRSPSHSDFWWKLNALRDDWDGESRIVWLDDDLCYELEAKRWLAARPVPTLGISPRSHLGLTRRHIAAIDEFVNR